MATNLYSECNTLILGCHFYSDSGLTSPVPNNFYSKDGNYYQVTGGLGEITVISTCPTQTTHSFNYNFQNTDSEACALEPIHDAYTSGGAYYYDINFTMPIYSGSQFWLIRYSPAPEDWYAVRTSEDGVVYDSNQCNPNP